MATKAINQHKQIAMGGKPFAKGGIVPLKTGTPVNPITAAKRSNGVPGYKSGGKVKC